MHYNIEFCIERTIVSVISSSDEWTTKIGTKLHGLHKNADKTGHTAPWYDDHGSVA